MKQAIPYKGYFIDYYATYKDLITVLYDGDDLVFDTITEAKKFIDELAEEW